MKKFTRVAVLLLSLVLVLSMGIFASADETSDASAPESAVESSVDSSAADSADSSESVDDSTTDSAEDSSDDASSSEDASSTEDSSAADSSSTADSSAEESSTADSSATEESKDDSAADKKEGSNIPWTLIIFLAIVVILVVVCFVCIKMQNKFGLWLVKFWKDYKSEISKVVWPSKEAIIKRTGVVLVCLLVCVVVMGLLDFGLAKLIVWLVGLAK